MRIYAIATQGRDGIWEPSNTNTDIDDEFVQYVASYNVKYSSDSTGDDTWHFYTEDGKVKVSKSKYRH